MTDATEAPSPRGALPQGRYGRSGDARTNRRLTVVGSVLGVAFLAVIGWFGISYVGGTQVSGELIKFDIVSDREVVVHLEVRKDADVTGVCTVTTRAEDGGGVGRADFTFAQRESRIDEVVTVRTTRRATTAQLAGCTAADGN
ncbi:DUF4307 domain-containing protein [Streptomyces sp. TRM43335]|uniref:DUF4307 domain-containing protein n=1 Tax=Streptomyces taklimakanensis TaxID=2569853 RepID=A0A6G2BEU2_9ACTN|nr:DUF4307 domain-containing protein [Streptomyces taklimakanensis]MTE20760.1 DUF4307 domain-containing protein [Streptomyces taklimakanensis]